MFASDSPENVEPMSPKKLPPVDIDRIMLDALDGGPGSMLAVSPEERERAQEFFNELLSEAHKLPSAEEKETFSNMVTDDSHKLPSETDRKAIEIMLTDEAPKFPSAYREYLDNFVPVENNAESHYMYIFGDMPFSMDATKKVPQEKVDEMMNAVAAEQLRRWGVELGIGRSDLVTHADINIPLSEEASQAAKDAVQKVMDEREGGVVFFVTGDVLSDDEIEARKEQ